MNRKPQSVMIETAVEARIHEDEDIILPVLSVFKPLQLIFLDFSNDFVRYRSVVRCIDYI